MNNNGINQLTAIKTKTIKAKAIKAIENYGNNDKSKADKGNGELKDMKTLEQLHSADRE